MAQAAFARICSRGDRDGKPTKEYTSFAKKFPSLIHTCGLAQAVAFAGAKKETDYLDDLSEVLKAVGHDETTDRASLADQTRTQDVTGYLRLSHDVLLAATWLKRYVEAATPDQEKEDS
jgi:CRISPR-associated protein Cmr5